MNYKENKIEEFLEKLSSTSSMPGGGVAASLVGANAVSLALKVCNLSLGKERYKDFEPLIKESIVKLEESRKNFLSFMDQDAKDFKAMEEVYAMPRATDEEKEKRKKALENACKMCCQTPAEVIKEVIAASKIARKLVGKTSISAASDLKIALQFFLVTIHSAWENIEINLKYIKDEEFKKPFIKMKEQIEALADNIDKNT